jgi:putative sigma-54 modulation protein
MKEKTRMDILIRTTGVTLTETLEATIEEKIGRVEHFAPRAIRARVHVRKVSAHASQRQYLVRVIVELPGNDMSAEQPGPDVISALDLVAGKIERRLSKLKTEQLVRHGHRTPRPGKE